MLVNVDQIQTVQGTSSGENSLILIPSVYLLEAFCSCGFQGISPAWIFPWLLLPHPFCWILLTSPHPDHRVHLIQSLAWFILSCFFFLPTLICKWSHSFSPYLPTISFILMASNAIYMLIIPKHITLNSSMVSRLTYLVADCIPTGISGLMCPQLSSHYGFHLSNCFFHCLLHLS